MKLTMKIFFCLVLAIVSVCGEPERRQSWRDGLWGREFVLDNAKRKDMASVSRLLKGGLSSEDSQYGYEYPETGQEDRLKNEVQDSRMSFPQVIGQQRSMFDLFGFPKQRKESRQMQE